MNKQCTVKYAPSKLRFWFSRRHCALLISLLAALLFSTACSTPVGVRTISSSEANQKLTGNVLSGGSLSAPTVQILNRFDLAGRFKDEPAEVISILHKGETTLKESDRLFALAELSFLHASHVNDASHYVASAIYAYAFLFPKDTQNSPNPVDPRLRTAIDIYNQGIAEVLSKQGDFEEAPDRLSLKTSFGKLAVALEPNKFAWGSFRLKDFTRASMLDIRGLRNRYRWPGIGAPMVATLKPLKGMKVPAFSRIPPGMKVPLTALLRIENIEEGLKTGNIQGTLEIYTPNEATTVTINGNTMPIEYELSAALASSLEGSTVYDIELKGLFSGDFALFKKKAAIDGLILTEPYRQNRIPIVLVHGTASSPARWAELVNEIINDKQLWGRYQFWLFAYNTGNPVLYSAGQLVSALRNTVNELDPEGKDQYLRKMVLIGHSQGGLLIKLAAINSGTRFWDNTFDKPFGELKVSDKTRELLRQTFFYEPLPMVKRVIFIATPHRGSHVAGGWIGRLVGTFIKVPFRFLNSIQEALTMNPDLAAVQSIKDIPRSTQNMDPHSTFISTLSSLPVDPGITTHSIISVKNPDDSKEQWTDGVVNYASAHIHGAASEFIVHSDHSIQSEPQTIEEIHRILLLHSTFP